MAWTLVPNLFAALIVDKWAVQPSELVDGPSSTGWITFVDGYGEANFIPVMSSREMLIVYNATNALGLANLRVIVILRQPAVWCADTTTQRFINFQEYK